MHFFSLKNPVKNFHVKNNSIRKNSLDILLIKKNWKEKQKFLKQDHVRYSLERILPHV